VMAVFQVSGRSTSRSSRPCCCWSPSCAWH
jgi:hypothetical protein